MTELNPADFADEPIVTWARERLRLTLWPGQAAILGHIYREGIRTAVLRLGRRSGKDTMASVSAVYESTVNADQHLAAVQPGEQVAVMVIHKSQALARWTHKVIRRYLRAYEASTGLAVIVPGRESQDTIELRNGIVIMTSPCHAANVRGPAVAVAVATEVAHWTGVDGSPLDAKEIIDSLEPALAQFPAGKLFLLSTPKLAVGYFHDISRLADSGRFAPRLAGYHATTQQMNPVLGDAFFAVERAKDPVNFAREYEAKFTTAISAVFDPELVAAAVVRERHDLSPQPKTRYVMALDPAMVRDTWSLVIGHREQSGRIIVDLVRGWRGTPKAPVMLEPTLDEIAGLSVLYNGAGALTDQYSAQAVLQGLRRRGIAVREQPWTVDSKAQAATSVRQALYAERLELPDHRELVGELVTLEQRPTAGGRERIAAPGRLHDDYATALMALVHDLAKNRGVSVMDIDANGRMFMRYETEQETQRRVDDYAPERTIAELRDAEWQRQQRIARQEGVTV